MNNYKSAMEKLQFDKQFCERTVKLLSEQTKEILNKQRLRKLVFCSAAVLTCIAAAAIVLPAVLGTQEDNPQVAITEPSPIQTNGIEEAEVINDRRVVVSSQYRSVLLDSYVAPGPGEVIVANETAAALEDADNEDAYFFVQILVIPQQQYTNTSSTYVYKGRSISEWAELAALNSHEYPYSEYNGDHGGHITGEQWEAVQEEAESLNAKENYEAAMAEYESEVVPSLIDARADCEDKEAERLRQLGYDVFIMDTWTYKSAEEKQSVRILAGLLMKPQILDFAASPECGYLIEWVQNGDGIVDWDEMQ